MFVAIIVAIVGAIGTISGPVLTYRILKKRFSGGVDSTEASELWEEAQNMRNTLREDIIYLKRENLKSAEDALKLHESIHDLRNTVGVNVLEIELLKHQHDECIGSLAKVRADRAEIKHRLEILEGK